MDHGDFGVELGSLKKAVVHAEGGLSNLRHADFDIVRLAGHKGGQIVGFGPANGNHQLAFAKPVRPNITGVDDELLEAVMRQVKELPEIHDLGGVGLAKFNSELGSKNFCHFDWLYDERHLDIKDHCREIGSPQGEHFAAQRNRPENL